VKTLAFVSAEPVDREDSTSLATEGSR